MRRYRAGAGSMDEAMPLADMELADRIPAEPGFVDYQAIDTGDGTITSVTIIEDEDQRLSSNDLAAEFVRDHLAAFEVERIDVFGGETMVRRAADQVLQGHEHRSDEEPERDVERNNHRSTVPTHHRGSEP
jgi:hypothetical protein